MTKIIQDNKIIKIIITSKPNKNIIEGVINSTIYPFYYIDETTIISFGGYIRNQILEPIISTNIFIHRLKNYLKSKKD